MKNTNFPRKKKALGQHFLRKQSVVDNMISRVKITDQVMEIGCGDGFLTEAILKQTPCKGLLCYEIDHQWADIVKENIRDPRLTIKVENILDAEFDDQKRIILANLPYQITFPILFMIQRNKHLFPEGVIMVQEEVAQKLVAKRGKKYSATSIFLQHHFNLELMEKIPPGAFEPPPKVHSRLVYFSTKNEPPLDEEFWKFLKLLFKQPRRTIENNIKTTHLDLAKFPSDLLKKRAQELSIDEFIEIWSAQADLVTG